MSLVLNRDDIKKGIGNPNTLEDYNADYVGQFYVDTNNNDLYVSTGKGLDTWNKIVFDGDKIKLDGENFESLTDEVVKAALEEIGDDILQQPAIQVGITGGVLDINADTYMKGDLYLWDASFEDEGDMLITGEKNTDKYEILQNKAFNGEGLKKEPGYTNVKTGCVIRITLPKEEEYQGGTFSLSGKDFYSFTEQNDIDSPNSNLYNYHNIVSFRTIKNNKITKSSSFGLYSGGSTSYFWKFNYNNDDYLEIALDPKGQKLWQLQLSVPSLKDKVWTQRNWSPNLIIDNVDELNSMEINETRPMLVQKIEKQNCLETDKEPSVPLNGQYIHFIGENHTVASKKGIVGGSDGDYFEKGKYYQFNLFVDDQENKWKVVSVDEIPKVEKPILAIPGKGAEGTLVAPSTEVDTKAMLLELFKNDENEAQRKPPIIDNILGHNNSGWNPAQSEQNWIYSAQTVEYRLNALKMINDKNQELLSEKVQGQLDTINENIVQEVSKQVSEFSEKDSNAFTKIDIKQGNSALLRLYSQGNTGYLDLVRNSGIDQQKELVIGDEKGDGTINKIKINANLIEFDGEIKNSNGRQDITLPSLRISSENQNFINTSQTSPAIDLNNGAIARTNQIIFSGQSTVPMGLFFPKFSDVDSGRYTGSYDYLNIRDGLLRTSAVISSDRNYIILDGKRIFFSETPPALAQDGDIWIQI